MKQGPYDNVIKFLYWWLKGFKLGMCKGETSILIIEWTYEMNEGVVILVDNNNWHHHMRKHTFKDASKWEQKGNWDKWHTGNLDKSFIFLKWYKGCFFIWNRNLNDKR